MNCIAIDDSENALELIKIHIEKIPFLTLVGVYKSALEAVPAINSSTIDLIFLDIEMPDIGGLQFTRTLDQLPPVIFTTAYKEYAIEGYEVNAVDYLLKPVSFERFFQAANKAYDQHRLKKGSGPAEAQPPRLKHVLFKTGTETRRVALDNIAFLESKGNYMKIQLLDGTNFMSLMTMSEALSKLESHPFQRCHRSYIIALRHIAIIRTHEVQIGSETIPVGVSYRDALKKKLEANT